MTAIVILITALVTGAAAAALSIARHPEIDPIDPRTEQRWLLRALASRPRLAALVARRLDRSRAGGLLLTLGVGAVFVLALLAGWVFDTIDESAGFARFDQSVAEWAATNANPASTVVLNVFTQLGGAAVLVVVTMVVAWFGWRRYGSRNVALFMATVAVAQLLVNGGLKLLVDRERPDISQLGAWSGSSFPSGHSAAAAAVWAAVALVLGLSAGRWVRALLAGGAFFVAGGVAATRALLGVHWLTDVIAGLAVGWAVFTAVAVAFGGRVMRFGARPPLTAHASPPARGDDR